MNSSLQVNSTNSGSATGNPRNKTALKQGRGLMDWVRLGNSGKDLSGTGGVIRKVTTEELAKHDKLEDAWMAIRGKVFNVTPYFEYHPGGEEELMRGAGKDATSLFNEVHQWVNYDSMLKHCYIGPLVESKVKAFSLPRLPTPSTNNFLKPTSTVASTKLPSFPQIDAMENRIKTNIKYDWFQTRTSINIAIYTKWKSISRRHIVAILNEKEVQIYVYVEKLIFRIHLDLLMDVAKDFQIRLGESSGKVDVIFTKSKADVHWPSIGTPLNDNNITLPDLDLEVDYYTFRAAKLKDVTHDTYILTLIPLNVMHFGVPLGYHVFLRLPDNDVIKPYTPSTYPCVPLKTENDGEQLKLFFKVYEDGALTPHLAKLQKGDLIQVGIPKGKFGPQELDRATKCASYLILLAAGTGITPMTSLLVESLTQKTKTHLIFFNKTEADIPWKEEWESLQQEYPEYFKVTHILSSPSDEWDGLTGRIRGQLLQNLLPVNDNEDAKPYACLCGPKGFTDLGKQLLLDSGYKKEDMHVFLG